jgi:tRNA pseudouridine38-40 synthase
VTRYKFIIEYNGTAYAGWQRQEDGIKSVQGTIEKAIFGFCQQDVTLHVAGRTDAGVHARGQVVHLDLELFHPYTPFELQKAINAHLKGKNIAIIDGVIVDDHFHARFSAKNKLYTYIILNRPAPPTLDKDLVWHVRRPLDVAAMRAASNYFLGTHDFTSFRDSQCQAKTPIKTLDRLDVVTDGTRIYIHTEAQSFLHHQVRNMVGSLALVGHGKWEPEMIKVVLDAKDRTKAGPTAPASGLYLMRVDY